MDRNELITRLVNVAFIPGLSGHFQVDPPPGLIDALPGLGVGGIIAVVIFWVYQNAVKAHHERETELLQENARVRLEAAERVVKVESEARASLAGLFSRSAEVQDRTNAAQQAMATALTELTGAVRGIADAQALAGRISSLESKIDAIKR